MAEVAAIWGGGTPQEVPLSPYIQGYWMSFIRSGSPNTYRKEGSPEWKTWGTSQSRLFFPNDPKKIAMVDLESGMEKRCDYFSSIADTVGN